MKTQLWIESHQPVPLVPLSMLKITPGDLIFIGRRVSAEEPDEAPGWVLAGPNGLFISLTTAAYFWDDDMDYEQSMGRRLQESESVLVRFTDAANDEKVSLNVSCPNFLSRLLAHGRHYLPQAKVVP